MSWLDFIKKGFGSNNEYTLAVKDLNKYGAAKIAKDDELEIKWYTKDKLKYYTVVCRCGNNRMLYHESGIRCHICGRFHSHENFNKMSQKARSSAKMNDGTIQQIPQPYVGVQRRNLQKRRSIIAP